MFRRPPSRKREFFLHETRWQRILRHVLIACLLCAVLWGFWEKSRQQEELLAPGGPVAFDQTGTLLPEELNAFAAYGALFNREYGVELVLRVRNTPFTDQEVGILAGAGPERRVARRVFLGLCPETGQVVLALPPLVERALGPDLVNTLRFTHFSPYFDQNEWPRGLATALNLMTGRLDAALSSSSTAGME